MSNWQFVYRSLLFHRRIHLAVACGVAAATAVLLGALLVGDSVTGSLRDLSLDRLGKIDSILLAPHFFRKELVDKLVQHADFSTRYRSATPALIFPRGTVEASENEMTIRSSSVLVVGCDDRFWDLCRKGVRPATMPSGDQIVLNEALAADLRVSAGDWVTVRLPRANAVPADSPLGEKEDRIRGITELEVIDVIPAEGLGRFSLTANQARPLVCFLDFATLQEPLEQEGMVNTILVAKQPGAPASSADDCLQLNRWLQPDLVDVGLTLTRARLDFESAERVENVFDYFSLSSNQMVIDDDAADVAARAFAPYHAQPAFTYLANAIIKLPVTAEELATAGVPYSTVSAIDSSQLLGPVLDERGRPITLQDNEIVINSWAARDQNVKVGDRVRLVYFEPETTHGVEVETGADFVVKAIAPITEPEGEYKSDVPPRYGERPTLANDPYLTPEVAGITDKESIDNWEIPFELTRKTRDEDDHYYKRHRLTPKAFVSLVAGQRLWGSRFGKVTSFRVPITAPDKAASFAEELARAFFAEASESETDLGLNFSPVRAQALAAAAGTTPFNGLFLGLSLFVISASLMLVSLLFRLGLEQRAAEVGLLLATGYRRGHATRLFVAEGAVVAAVGGLFGIALGVAYAWLMLAGLRTIWVGAISTPFLSFHWTETSLLVGYVLGVLVCVMTIYVSVRHLRRISSRRLLAGQAQDEATQVSRRPARWTVWGGVTSLSLAFGLAGGATQLGGESQAGLFVAGGVSILTALLCFTRWWMVSRPNSSSQSLSTASLATRNAWRNPQRSTLTIGLIATASFLIVAMSCFRLSPTNAGAGGFNLVAESSEPIFADLNDPQIREEYIADTEWLQDASIIALRLKPGDDASCNNLYRATRPRVLGVPANFIHHYDEAATAFEWASSAATTPDERANPWQLLQRDFGDGSIPVVIDKNTAMYSLQIYGVGQERTYSYDGAGEVTFRVVGMLANSVLQGSLLISEEHFTEEFKQSSGYQYFLISAGGPPAKISQSMEDAFGDQGLDVRESSEILRNLLAVQNTYLSTFQSLGALGLLLGTIGLATVQFRNVVERRAELALLRATGFAVSRLTQLVLLENLILLAAGLLLGILAALFAVMPHALLGSASPPGWELTIMLASVAFFGALATYVATKSSLTTPILTSLRGD